MPVQIYKATQEDAAQIVALSYGTFYENHLETYKCQPDFDKIVTNVTDAIDNGIVLTIRDDTDSRIVDGVMIISKTSTWFSTHPILMSNLICIKKEKRTFKRASALLKAAQNCAIINEVPLCVDLFVLEKDDKKDKLLKYLGFGKLGSLYVYNAKLTNRE